MILTAFFESIEIYLILFFEFFKIGLFTFGGGYAMIPLVREVVLEYGWMSEDAFTNFIGVCESTPGPIAVNMATYVGSSTGGIIGSIMATIGVVLPSMIIIILILTLLKLNNFRVNDKTRMRSANLISSNSETSIGSSPAIKVAFSSSCLAV